MSRCRLMPSDCVGVLKEQSSIALSLENDERSELLSEEEAAPQLDSVASSGRDSHTECFFQGVGTGSEDDSWREFFRDPSQWWDNRSCKRNPRAPDFKHRVTGKGLWVDGWFTAEWVKIRLAKGK